MTARIVGIVKTDVTINSERIKNTKFNLVLDAREKGLTGQDVGIMTWNELTDGEPPKSLYIGKDIEVEYNKKAKLQFSDENGRTVEVEDAS